MFPDNLVNQVVGLIGFICDGVAVDIEGCVIAPVIAAGVIIPLNPACAHIFDLGTIVNEAVVDHLIAFGPAGKMNADLAAFKPVFQKSIFIGIINENAFLIAIAHNFIVGDFGAIGIV